MFADTFVDAGNQGNRSHFWLGLAGNRYPPRPR